MKSALMTACLAVLVSTLSPTVAQAATTVCVDVEMKSWTRVNPDHSEESDDEAKEEDFDPYAIDPTLYLGRMVQYEVTHEVGYAAVEANCIERLTIELYPLRAGWTVFARYSGHSREEKIDLVQLDEFVPLAQRLTTALLRDRPITDVINRENVLRADSQADLRTIDGEGHFLIGLGTELRAGYLDTAQSSDQVPGASLQFLTPLNIQVGYRGKYQAWGLDAFTRMSLGVSKRSPRRNSAGGHTDFEYGGSFGLHFLRYFNSKGMTSGYWGGGAQFRLNRFSIIRPEDEREQTDREDLFGGGLDLDIVFGWEFMRASSVHFFLQGELHVPTYKMETEVDSGGIDSYMPGALLQIGMIF